LSSQGWVGLADIGVTLAVSQTSVPHSGTITQQTNMQDTQVIVQTANFVDTTNPSTYQMQE
jgi:hypothetical protein